ncbi:hypothetical protein EE612_055160 [Oryza sativa]|nr:hypothetical protein EE612_055160 [Oryza sativa]
MDVVGAASWLVQVVLEKLVGDGIDAAWAAARRGTRAAPTAATSAASAPASRASTPSSPRPKSTRPWHAGAARPSFALSVAWRASPPMLTTCSTKCCTTKSTDGYIRTSLVPPPTLAPHCLQSN